MNVLDPFELQHELDDQRVEAIATALTTHTRPSRTRRRLPRFVLAGSLATAIATVLLFAVLPARVAKGPATRVGPQSAAAEVLTTAARNAGDAEWTPLGDNNFYYSRVRYFSPATNNTDPEPAAAIPPSDQWTTKGDLEAWVAPNGRSRKVVIRPMFDDFPIRNCQRMQPVIHFNNRRVVVRDPCRALAIEQWATTTGSGPSIGRQIVWTSGDAIDVSEPRPAAWNEQVTTARELMLRQWGATHDEINGLPHDGAALDAAVAQLLESSTERELANFIPSLHTRLARSKHRNFFDVSSRLLGAAPMPPAARKSLFSLLAARDDARLLGPRTDRLGRRGTAIKFVLDVVTQQPARVISERQFVTEMRAEGLPDEFRVKVGKRRFHLPAMRSHERSTLVLIIDVESGELLQSTSEAWSSWRSWSPNRSTSTIPAISANSTHGVHPITTAEVPSRYRGSGSHGAREQLWIARGPVEEAKSQQPFCIKHPKIC